MQSKDYVVQEYEKVLNGENKVFSSYFFQKQHKKERLISLIKYFVEEKLKATPEKILELINYDLLEEYKLTVLIKMVEKPIEFKKEDYTYIIFYAYPELYNKNEEEIIINVYKEVLSGERKSFPRGYFNDGMIGEKRAIICFKYLIEKILQYDTTKIEEIFFKSNINVINDLMKEYKLSILNNVFISYNDLLRSAYSEVFIKK